VKGGPLIQPVRKIRFCREIFHVSLVRYALLRKPIERGEDGVEVESFCQGDYPVGSETVCRVPDQLPSAARCTVAGMTSMPAIRKGQFVIGSSKSQAPAEQFYALAA
jgi:hypothetical protein